MRVQLDEQVGDGGEQEVRVEVRHDPSAGGTWSQGISGLLSWLGGPPDGLGGSGDLDQLAADGGAGHRDQLVGGRAAAGRALAARSCRCGWSRSR